MKKEKYYIHIDSKPNLLNFNIKELIRYRDLIILFTKRTFSIMYKQTVLGPIWLFLKPFLTSIMYVVVFGGIAGLSTDGVPMLLFYLSSQAMWSFFSSCLTKTATTFTANADIFGKVYFPRLTMPISTVLSSGIDFFIQMILVSAFWIYYIAIGAIDPHFIELPLIFLVLLQLGCLGLGFGIIISSLTTKYRDLAIVVDFGAQLWMYATPVVYPLSQIHSNKLLTLVCMNPVTEAIETFRYIILGVGNVSVYWWIISVISTIVFLFIGIILFNKIEKTFMDTI